ncbi:MAG: TetR/AcrR family transcriptional regulator [Bradymonadia bacterium]
MVKTNEKRKPGRPSNPVGRPKLIELARQVFASAGYAGASLSRIAEAAGIRKASLYHHFDTKEALYLAVMDDVIADLQGVFVEAVASQGDFVYRLDEAAQAAISYLARQPDAAKILLREMVDGGPFVQAHGAQAINFTLAVAAQFFEAGMDAGTFKRQDPLQLTLAISGMCLFAFAGERVSKRLLSSGHDAAVTNDVRVTFIKEQVKQLAVGG